MIAIPNHFQVTRRQFEQICQANPDRRFELDADGVLLAMPPTHWQSGRRNQAIATQLGLWQRQTQLGCAFDSSTGFQLPNGAIRSPDAAWVTPEQLAQAEARGLEEFFPGAPAFVIELASGSDRPEPLRAKLQEYLASGTQLGWLLLPALRQLEIYRPGTSVVVLDQPQQVSAEPLLPGFTLELSGLWE